MIAVSTSLRSAAVIGAFSVLAGSSSVGWASIPVDCAASDGTAYALAWEFNENLSAYLAPEDQRVVLANCTSNEMIDVKASDLSKHVGHAMGEIERMVASDTTYTFDDVAARLRDQNYAADVVPLRRDGCVCEET